jgi:hypothetical protein
MPDDRQTFAPQKWEYRVLVLSGIKVGFGVQQTAGITEKELNKLGDEGWELVGVGAQAYYFKRRKAAA